jgi:hypothetical protein
LQNNYTNGNSKARKAASKANLTIRHSSVQAQGKQGTPLERSLATRELGHATTATATTATTAAKASPTTEASPTATITTAASASSTGEATTAAAVTTIVLARGAEVQTDRSASQVLALESGHGSASLIHGTKLHVSEALGAARLLVGGQTDSSDGTVLRKELADLVLVGSKGDVSNKQGVASRAG